MTALKTSALRVFDGFKHRESSMRDPSTPIPGIVSHGHNTRTLSITRAVWAGDPTSAFPWMRVSISPDCSGLLGVTLNRTRRYRSLPDVTTRDDSNEPPSAVGNGSYNDSLYWSENSTASGLHCALLAASIAVMSIGASSFRGSTTREGACSSIVLPDCGGASVIAMLDVQPLASTMRIA